MSYLEGKTFEYKKDANGIWQHKNCKGIGINEVNMFKEFGSTFLMCTKNGCASSAEQVMRFNKEGRRSSIED